MLEILFNAFTIDQFLIALAGQFVNEGSAKITLTAVKALGVTIMGVALDHGKSLGVGNTKAKRQRKKKRLRACPSSKNRAVRKRNARAASRSRTNR